jgi:U3 small nucleolar RNA-associated protein MPP10
LCHEKDEEFEQDDLDLVADEMYKDAEDSDEEAGRGITAEDFFGKRRLSKRIKDDVAAPRLQAVGGKSAKDEEAEEDAMEAFLDDMEDMETKRQDRELKRASKKAVVRGHKGAVEDDDDQVMDDMDLIAEEMYKDDESDEEADVDGDGESSHRYMAKDFFGAQTSATRGIKAAKKRRDEEDDEDDEEEEGDEDFDGEDDFDEAMIDENYEGDDIDDDEGDDDVDVEDGELDEGEDIDDESGDEIDGADGQGPSVPLTSYQKRKQKLLAEQATLETELLQPKQWQMKGESKGKDRPVNSLLEMTADVERASKPTPVITLEHTSTLEDMILKRVIDGKYNDVQPPAQRKEKSGDAPELSQEKDKLGLGEIYAQEYLAKTLEGGDADANKRKGGDDEKRAEIKSLFMKVCRSLDELSHFHYTPKPVNQEGAITVGENYENVVCVRY